ncbi:MAG: Teichoic acid export ATP-binding protein TagH [Pseudomonadota bacterium]|jgi:lipopolysaccharide transport system ATP-binding protein
MSSNAPVIALESVGKTYKRFAKPSDRFWQAVWPSALRGDDAKANEFVALAPLSLKVQRGEALGLIGRNGAGKSTLLQMVCGTLNPSSGSVKVNGKIGALLELGAGFNPEFTGRENVYLAAAVMGLSGAETDALYESIVEFSGIREFIDQPVKTYSSGMYVRLAFSIATSANPDILVIDEALSVGDGAFAKKSFERIMQLKAQGTTVLFCSHSMYQVESFCDRAVWLDHGQVQMEGPASDVVAAYTDSLRAEGENGALHSAASVAAGLEKAAAKDGLAADANALIAAATDAASSAPAGLTRITSIEVSVDGVSGRDLQAVSLQSDVHITVKFESDPAQPCPTFATGFALPDGQIFTSAYTLFDGVTIERDAQGRGQATVVFEKLPLMKGRFSVGAYLFDERALHVYDVVLQAATVVVTQPGVHQGFVQLPHRWQ